TEGRLELGDVLPLDGTSADELLRITAIAEQRSEHPLARLIIQEASRRGLPLEPIEEFEAYPGVGVPARALGSKVLVGTRRLFERQGILVSTEATGLLDRLDASGQTALLVVRDGKTLGALGARDRVRPEAAAVIAELRALGIQGIALLTGDRRAAALALA